MELNVIKQFLGLNTDNNLKKFKSTKPMNHRTHKRKLKGAIARKNRKRKSN